eukprot:XP_001690770.1 hypothetical protein CHLREDRAFT_188547 [Chlamydomonas reinhardtii]
MQRLGRCLQRSALFGPAAGRCSPFCRGRAVLRKGLGGSGGQNGAPERSERHQFSAPHSPEREAHQHQFGLNLKQQQSRLQARLKAMSSALAAPTQRALFSLSPHGISGPAAKLERLWKDVRK